MVGQCLDRRIDNKATLVSEVAFTNPFGALSHGATNTQCQGLQVSVAKIRRSGKPGPQPSDPSLGSYIQSISAAAA